MNDFLKSLRSNSKDKRFDRNSRRPYGSQYNGNPQYRSGEDINGNLKKSHSASYNNEKLTQLLEEALPDIKSLMESISENQKRRAVAEERKAEMMENIAKSFQALLNSEFSLPLDHIIKKQPCSGEHNNSIIENNNGTPPDREEVLKIIFSMRKKGTTFGEIASYLDSQNIPTFSKKGAWHAQTIHRICKKFNK